MNRILIVKLGSIGDVVHALPVLRTIRHNLPNAYIVWVVEEKAREVLNGNEDIDKVVTINTKKWRKAISTRGGVKAIAALFSELTVTINELRKDKFDIAIDLQGLVKSGVISYLSGAKTIIGFDSKNCREFLNTLFTNKKVSPEKGDIHIVDKNISLLRPLGFKKINKEFYINPALEGGKFTDEFLLKNRTSAKHLIAINPGAGWKTKEWGIKNYAELGDRIISEFGVDVIITWGPGEEEMAKAVMDSMSHIPIIAPPTAIGQLAALLKKCELFIGGDTGPLHIAAAMKTPTIGIYGPSDPLRNGPYGDNHIVIHKKIECSGCYKRNCDTVKCMKAISVNDVLSVVKKKLRHQPMNAGITKHTTFNSYAKGGIYANRQGTLGYPGMS